MVEEQPSGRDALPDALVATLADPATGRARVPYLLTVLDEGEPRHRLAAGTALCLVAEADPEVGEAVAERLLDRLGSDAHDEVGYALDYLAARHHEAVEQAAEALDGDAERRARTYLSRSGDEGEFGRSDPPASGPTPGSDSDSDDDPRRVYGTGAANRGEPPIPEDEGVERDRGEDVEKDRDGADSRGRDAEGDDGVGDDGTVSEESESGESSADGVDEEGPGTTRVTLRAVSRRLSEIVATSEFDELTVLTEGRRDRHGVVYRSAARKDSEEYAVALTVYRLPADHESFVAGFRTAMDRWEAADAHRSILSVYDWSARPRPWAAVEYAGESLATRSDPPSDPLWTAIELASGVAHAHQQGLVHGALDPGTVRYRDAVVDESERRQPLLSNPQIATLSRTLPGSDRSQSSDGPDGADPGGVDPRYAAPEHYDDSYGRVDASTDVYGLGALLFRLCTDHHPYTGDAGTVRGKVLSDGAPDPRRVNPELPDSLHRIIRKATATRKLKRYETVTAFERELTQARERLLEAVDDA
jgi:hypothetical protein